MNDTTRHYSTSELTVVWQPDVCIHSRHCFSGLPDVFNPKNRPWVTIDGASTEHIIKQVNACPSGALSYVRHDVGNPPQSPTVESSDSITT